MSRAVKKDPPSLKLRRDRREKKEIVLEKQSRELHEYLREKLGHNWRFDTWKDKYKARIRKYGLDTCKRAIDGFCYPYHNWYVRTLSHRAPELIFRSDKSLETFLAKAPEVQQTENKEQKEEQKRIEDYRKKLETENKGLTARFHRKIRNSELKENINALSWQSWIKPLLVVGMRDGFVVLFHESPSWVQEYYSAQIQGVLGKPVRVVNKPEVRSC